MVLPGFFLSLLTIFFCRNIKKVNFYKYKAEILEKDAIVHTSFPYQTDAFNDANQSEHLYLLFQCSRNKA